MNYYPRICCGEITQKSKCSISDISPHCGEKVVNHVGLSISGLLVFPEEMGKNQERDIRAEESRTGTLF